MRKISLLILLAVLTAALLCGCEDPKPTEPPIPTTTAPQPTSTVYEVTVEDALGTPYTSGVIVKFVQDGQQAAMLPISAQGVVSKELPTGEYTVELLFTGDADYHYDTSALSLSAEKTKLTVVLSNRITGEATSLFAQGKDVNAYPVGTGGTYAELTPGQRNFFIFTPAEAGTYAFSVIGEGAQIGYYGAPHFVYDHSSAEVVDNRFTVSISASMIGTGITGTTRMVIGVDAGELTECILVISRIGNPEVTISDYPWQVYQTTAKLEPYTLPAGVELKEFDISASSAGYTLVLNENDGFYHLNTADGPLVLMRLGVGSAYIPGYQKILETAGVVKYFFNEEGVFVKKESYSECLLEYIACMDADTGVYPLTEDLKYIIQQNGDHSGWWNAEGETYLFVDAAGNKVAVREDLAWLFMCCYIGE